MMKMKNLIIVVFLSVVSFGVFAQEVITASAISLNEAIENLENKAKEKDSTIVKITSAGGQNPQFPNEMQQSESLVIHR